MGSSGQKWLDRDFKNKKYELTSQYNYSIDRLEDAYSIAEYLLFKYEGEDLIEVNSFDIALSFFEWMDEYTNYTLASLSPCRPGEEDD